jgi:hypothetical protein
VLFSDQTSSVNNWKLIRRIGKFERIKRFSSCFLGLWNSSEFLLCKTLYPNPRRSFNRCVVCNCCVNKQLCKLFSNKDITFTISRLKTQEQRVCNFLAETLCQTLRTVTVRNKLRKPYIVPECGKNLKWNYSSENKYPNTRGETLKPLTL